MIRHFVNLSAGIEAIKQLDLAGEEIEFIRIRSTDCEHKLGPPQWDAILAELDANFLMALARGDKCIVYDCSKGGGWSHAQSHGLQWIWFVLNLAWLDQWQKPVMVDGEDWSDQFRIIWRKAISKRTKQRIAYFRNFLATDEIRLTAWRHGAKHDGDWKYYLRVLRDVGR